MHSICPKLLGPGKVCELNILLLITRLLLKCSIKCMNIVHIVLMLSSTVPPKHNIILTRKQASVQTRIIAN